MLDKQVLAHWCERAVLFANQPDDAPDAEAEALLRLRADHHDPITGLTDWDRHWVSPAGGYKKLRRAWVRHLAYGQHREREQFLAWCEKNSLGLPGAVLYLYELATYEPPYDRPMGLAWELIEPPSGRAITFVNRPEALLANVGLELLSATRAFSVKRCVKCKAFFPDFKAPNRPPKKCPPCRKDLSTDRVREFRRKHKP